MDESVVALLSKISHVYAFLIEDHIVANVAQIKEPLSEISKLIPNCVVFIQSYSKTKSFCMSYSLEVQCSTNVSMKGKER